MNFDIDRDIINFKARYSILGAMIGDSLGTSLEFTSQDEAKKIILENSNFDNGLLGGGPFGVVPGQFTDDTEMSLAIMNVIVKFGKYDQQLVAESYHKWWLSEPFDIGYATQNAVSQNSVYKMILVAKTKNLNSLSNGFLMRLPGLIGLYRHQDISELWVAISEDVILTHGHNEIINIAKIYGTIVYKAIRKTSANKIYELVEKISSHKYTNCPLFVAICKSINNDKKYFEYNGKKYLIAEIDSSLCGFVGYALWLLLYCLKNYTSYRDALLKVISYGGDTDTNGCIVGAVMGALYPDTIPRKWISSLINFSNTSRFEKYPIADPKIWKNWLP